MSTARKHPTEPLRDFAPSAAIEASHAGRRYGSTWALQDCTLALPTGSVTALVGPNGAGKTTLLKLLVGLLPPSTGELRVVGEQPSSRPEFLARVGVLAQEVPLYKHYTVADLLRFGKAMNPAWDAAIAHERLAAADVPLNRQAGKLSGGQRAQVGLALAVAKRPQVLLLDEPLAALDPLARRDFLRGLLDITTATGITVVLSSHLIGELARACDHLVVLRGGRLQLAGELDMVVEQHHWITGASEYTERLPDCVEVISRERHERHDTLLVRSEAPLLNPHLQVSPVGIEDLVLAYLETPVAPAAGLAMIGTQR
jgi:ABC-2 type transport system ATP-binding protein